MQDGPADFLAPLLRWDASGRDWLPRLLAATPEGATRLGELVEAPGWLVTPLAVATVDGRLAAFTYTLPAPRELLAWLIDHPEQLHWPPGVELSREGELLRRALISDAPPGARARAQSRAREALATGGLAPAWWRFEEPYALPAALISHRLVVTVGVGDPLAPANPWFPERTHLVRVLEAARQLAEGRRTATLWWGEAPPLAPAQVASAVASGAPHLSAEARDELSDGYLGALDADAAGAAVADTLERLRASRRHGTG